jgi:PKD repeat protein
MQKGPLVSYVFTDTTYNNWLLTHHSPDDYLPYELSSSINHVILIVGWKDDSSIGKGGYWICKNSWGTIFGYDGFFNIEYESHGIDISPMTWVDYEPDSYNWHPVPKAYGPYYGLTSQPLQFKGNASGEHPPFTWLWDFGDGATSEEQNPIHTYLSKGDYDVTLTVTDANNKSFYAITSAWIQETNQPPQTPIIEGPKIIWKGTNWRYNYTVYDPDGGVIYLYLDMFNVCPGLWYGPWPSNEKTSSIFPSSESGAGAYTVRMKAKDPYGAESDWATLKVIVMKSKAESLADVSLFFRMIFNQHPLFEKILGL